MIIFGGDTPTEFLSPADALYALDINRFNWYIPKISGKIPSSRSFHKTVLIGKYMTVSFGKYNNYLVFYKLFKFTKIYF